MNKFRDRWITGRLQQALAALPVTVLTGVRQSGKTTLALHAGKERNYVTLDDLGDEGSGSTGSPIALDLPAGHD